MIPRFWMPLAASYAWSFALTPSTRWLNRMLACTFLQCISCVYTGWFLVGGLAIFLPLAVALRTGGWAETRRFVKENRRRVALIVGLWIALHLAAFVPYMVVNADISRSYQECAGLLPTPAAWLTGPAGTCWDQTLGPRAGDPTQPAPGWRAWVSDECYLFSGFGVYVLMLAASAYLFIVRRPDQPPEFALARAGLLTAIIWAILTLTLKQGGHSLWEVVRLLPGATAIRCVSRVYVVIYLFGTLAALIWLSRIADPLRPLVRLDSLHRHRHRIDLRTDWLPAAEFRSGGLLRRRREDRGLGTRCGGALHPARLHRHDGVPIERRLWRGLRDVGGVASQRAGGEWLLGPDSSRRLPLDLGRDR